MPSLRDLARTLEQLEGRSYGEYRRIKGSYDGGFFELWVDHVQGDPFAAPSKLRVLLHARDADLPAWALSSAARVRATRDFLNRSFVAAVRRCSSRRGSGRSGELLALVPGQQVLARSSLLIDGGAVEARFRAGLPARGRRILGRQAAEMLGEDVADAVEDGLLAENLDLDGLREHVETVEDAAAMRDQLAARGLVAFVGDGAILPRRSGVDDRPLEPSRARPFQSPDELLCTLEAPNRGPVQGMGVPQGITLIVGGGYHGKSTLLRAIERGVYDHVPGDGREAVVTVPDAVKVRAEDGRSVAGTDISNFIDGLPGGTDTRSFFTENASGSTSQAASIVEALEVGATCLLLDEDTSATNFMIRDGRMQALIADEHEPITPFIDRARQLYEDEGISTVVVVGGAGDYFDVADTVIAMRDFEPYEVTAKARRIAREQPTTRRREGGRWHPVRGRVPLPASIDPGRGRREVDIKVRSTDRLTFGSQELDLAAVEQIVELAQTRGMAEAVAWARGGAIDGERTVPEALRRIVGTIRERGFDAITGEPSGELAEFRILELAAFLARIRGLRMGG